LRLHLEQERLPEPCAAGLCGADQVLDRLTHHCDIVETGNESWRFKSRDDDHTARARQVSATPTSSDEASATLKTRRSKGSKLDADVGSNLNAD
jgi:hypothetical protein